MHSFNPYGRGVKLARMLRILIALSSQSQWRTVSELAEICGAPDWTVRRDLKMFELAGIPLQSMHDVGPGVGGRYKLPPDWTNKFLKKQHVAS